MIDFHLLLMWAHAAAAANAGLGTRDFDLHLYAAKLHMDAAWVSYQGHPIEAIPRSHAALNATKRTIH